MGREVVGNGCFRCGTIATMDPADFYSGIVVDAYSKLKSSTFEAEPYASFVASHGQPGLEIDCGDGHPMLDLCASGLDVDGVDSSVDMVKRCRENAARRGLQVLVHHQRVQDLALGRRYSSIYFAGPTFNLLADNQTALRALVAIHEHLSEDGEALIPLWIPDPTPAGEIGLTRTTEDEIGVELRYTPTSEVYNVEARTRTTSTKYERVTSTGSESVDRDWIVHWHTPTSFTRLSTEAGLRLVHLRDHDTGEAASTRSTEFTATVRRR